MVWGPLQLPCCSSPSDLSPEVLVDSAGDDTVAETHVSPETRYLLARGPALQSGKDIMPKRSRGPCRNTGWASREPKTFNLMCQHPALSLVILERITDDRLEAALSVLCSGLSRWFRGHGTPSISQGLAPVPTPVAASPPHAPLPPPSPSVPSGAPRPAKPLGPAHCLPLCSHLRSTLALYPVLPIPALLLFLSQQILSKQQSMPGTLPGCGDTAENKTDLHWALRECMF